jgi:hypothetical protein
VTIDFAIHGFEADARFDPIERGEQGRQSVLTADDCRVGTEI